jgi:mono/diheme cytochrome c family protein
MRKGVAAVKYGLFVLVVAGLFGFGLHAVKAEPGVEKEPCKPRVPADQLAEAKANKSPLGFGADVVAEGKAIFEGKGTCFTCHGMDGKGDGDAGKALDPGPRNMTNPEWHKCKTEGEMFWVIKNGSPGTGMIPAVNTGILTEEEAWKAIAYERTFAGK